MSEPTFRDFAAAVMSNDTPRAASILEVLLALAPARAEGAATHFRDAMAADPAFLPKAMSLRTVVTEGTDDAVGGLLRECFGLAEDEVGPSVAAIRARYPRGG